MVSRDDENLLAHPGGLSAKFGIISGSAILGESRAQW